MRACLPVGDWANDPQPPNNKREASRPNPHPLPDTIRTRSSHPSSLSFPSVDKLQLGVRVSLQMTDSFWNQHRPQPQPQLPPHPQLQLQPQPQSQPQSLVLPSQGLPKRPRLDFGVRFFPGPFQYSCGWNLEILDFLCCC